MGRKLIITEEEKNNILSLYEQYSIHQKEDDFLKKYIGKTFITYQDPNFRDILTKETIDEIYYSFKYDKNTRTTRDGIIIETKINSPNYTATTATFTFGCLYNPNKISYEGKKTQYGKTFKVFNKTLIDDINTKGTSNGIEWCRKPQADFGLKQT
jgi:hypothetical protein